MCSACARVHVSARHWVGKWEQEGALCISRIGGMIRGDMFSGLEGACCEGSIFNFSGWAGLTQELYYHECPSDIRTVGTYEFKSTPYP